MSICDWGSLWKDKSMKRISICVLSVLLFLPAQSTAAKAVESSIPICVNTARGTIRYTNSGKCKAKTESLVQMNTDGSPTPALKKFTYQAGDIGPAGGYIFLLIPMIVFQRSPTWKPLLPVGRRILPPLLMKSPGQQAPIL
jgi:hypothetical protein